jgi:hypothetical protein
MVRVGLPERDYQCVFQYRRCETCGFTVRRLLRTVPDEAALEDLRQIFARTFKRRDGAAG